MAGCALQSYQCSIIQLQLPISNLQEEFRVSCIREVLVYQDSRVASAGIVVQTGRKWKVLEIAESQ